MMYSLGSTLGFGKYSGLTVEAIAKFDPRYLAWAHHNLEWFELDEAARAVVGPAARRERDFAVDQQNAWAWGFGRDAKSARQRHTAKLVKIEGAERRKAGQECMIDSYGRVKWIAAPSRDTRRMAETPKSGSVRSTSGANSSKPNHIGETNDR